MVKEINVTELQNMFNNKEDFQLVDVREQHEFEDANLGGDLIPLSTVPVNVNKFLKDKKVVVHCRSGKRSENAIKFLEANHGYTNLYNLKGGILAWKAEIDDTLDVS